MKTSSLTARTLKIIFISSLWIISIPTRASFELDQQFSLESVATLKSWDNVDGLFEEYVDKAYKDYFSKETRFVLRDSAPAIKVLVESKIPYKKIIHDDTILKQLGRTVKAETLIRTRVYKEGARYRFALDWLHSVRLDVLASHEFYVEEPKKGDTLNSDALLDQIKRGLDELMLQVPFIASVTGRDNDWVTLNIGGHSVVKPNDLVVISTLEDVRRHPLLRKVVEWKTVETGRAQVKTIDGGMAFAQVISEEPKRQIARLQKVTKILPPDQAPVTAPATQTVKVGNDVEVNPWYARLGYGNVGPWIGLWNRDYNNGATLATSGIVFGAAGRGELWFTQNMFAQLDMKVGFAPGGSIMHLAGAVGYKHFIDNTVMGPAIWGRAGFRSTSYSLALDVATGVGPNSFAGIMIGVGGSLPIREGWVGELTFDMGLLGSHTETGLIAGTPQSSVDVSAYIGVLKILWPPRLGLRIGLGVDATGATYSGNRTLSQKSFYVSPSVVYYF